MIKKIVFVLFTLVVISPIKADEGMWLPMLLERYNYADMREMGLRLTAEEIYNINNSSLKDAIVSLNGGYCSGSMISENGLLLTNHHCVLGNIQKHSTLDKNFIEKGYWATNRGQELRNEHLSATFLIKVMDVTQEVMAVLSDGMSERERMVKIDIISSKLITDATRGTNYTGQVKSFYYGNEFYLFLYESYNDVRLVVAPPMSIGKFGGETDNWNWPRHTIDFAILRIYMAPNGSPASYNKKNIPYVPKKYLPISTKGVKKDDFTFVLGYPGTTNRLTPSYGVDMLLDYENPIRIKVRTKKLELMKSDMELDAKINIQYTSKYAKWANYWKYYIGQSEIIEKLDVYEKKKAQEDRFVSWVNGDRKRLEKYGDIMDKISESYERLVKCYIPMVHSNESIFYGPEIMLFVYKFLDLYLELELAENVSDIDRLPRSLSYMSKKYFKNYNPDTDMKIFITMMEMYKNDIEPEFHPEVFKEIEKKHNGSFETFIKEMFNESMFVDKDRLLGFLREPDLKILTNDVAFSTMKSVIDKYRETKREYLKVSEELDSYIRLYMAGLMEMDQDKKRYPDANKTMRITYGKVLDYDKMNEKYYTTLSELMTKVDESDREFSVPPKLKKLYKSKNLGTYAKDGDVRICFISNNDITGGNSGSAILNAEGEIVGIVFDHNWEATSTTIAFEPEYTRCISVDIQAVLFVLEKYAENDYILKELTLN